MKVRISGTHSMKKIIELTWKGLRKSKIVSKEEKSLRKERKATVFKEGLETRVHLVKKESKKEQWFTNIRASRSRISVLNDLGSVHRLKLKCVFS
jgi:hypothetical protein